MPLDPQRYSACKAQLDELLQGSTDMIRDYYSEFKIQAPSKMAQVDRLWELTQRYQLICLLHRNRAAFMLSVCDEAYEPIKTFINLLYEKLTEISKQVEKFERTIVELHDELCELPKKQLNSLAHWSAWLAQTLSVLQKQAKYLQMHLRYMHPEVLTDATCKRFKTDLQLAEYHEANFILSLAKADHLSELLPSIMPT